MSDEMRLLQWYGGELKPAADQPPAGLRRRVLSGEASNGSAGPVEARSGSPVRVGRLVTAVAAAAVALAGSVVATDARLPSPTPHRREARSPSQVLELAAQQVALTSDLSARPDQFVYTESLVVRQDISVNGWMARQGQVLLVRRWQSVDGTRNSLTRERPVDAPGTTTTWTVQQVPARTRDPAPPADADSMYRFLYRPAPVGAREWRGHDVGADGLALERATDVLSSGTALPAVQEAVFRALRRIPRISTRARAVDVAGRSGIGLVYTGLGGEIELVFDATTYRYLGMNRQLARPFAEIGRGISVVVREAVQRVAVVDRVGDLG
jgi:hypothetical protein